MRTCTWAPTVFQGNQVVDKYDRPSLIPAGDDLTRTTKQIVQRYEAMGLSDLLIAQRWWGNGEDIEASSLDCLAMTSFFAAHTEKLNLITAIHPGFFHPTVIAKWASTIQRLTSGRWAINVTSGWNMDEFSMYGIDQLSHDERYERSKEFIDLLRLCWAEDTFSFNGSYYQTRDLALEPRPEHRLEVFQGGQSPAAIEMAAAKSDWMFLNGGSLERIQAIVEQVRAKTTDTGRTVRFAMYAAPLCRDTDELAWAEIDKRLSRIDKGLVQQRKERLRGGASGMWGDDDDPLSHLDSNEGFAARLIGSPETIINRVEAYRSIGVDMLHLDLRDQQFCKTVLPDVIAL